jgi:endo-1,4-beta-xylanase
VRVHRLVAVAAAGAALAAGSTADAFRWAHAADPHALLFYNDYNIAGEDGSNAKSDAV